MRHFQSKTSESILVTQLRPLLEERGFEWVGAMHQFRKATERGFVAVVLAISPYESDAIIEFHLGIRIDAVENLAYSYTNGLMGFRPNSMTLVTPLSRILDKRFQRFTVKNELEVKQVAQILLRQLEQRGFDFLSTYESLATLDYLFNHAPNLPLNLVHQQVNRALRGLALAKLNQRNDLALLIQQYRDLLAHHYATDMEKLKFDEFSQFLLNYSFN
ncbi:MAG: hypothetical protein AB8G22_25715 [Saprospiraceae bacterium]